MFDVPSSYVFRMLVVAYVVLMFFVGSSDVLRMFAYVVHIFFACVRMCSYATHMCFVLSAYIFICRSYFVRMFFVCPSYVLRMFFV